MALRTDYQDYVPNAAGKKYVIADAGDGLSTITDATTYDSVGDTFNAGVINATNAQVNKNTLNERTATLSQNGWSGNMQTVSVIGVTENSIVFVSAATESLETYSDAGIYCSDQGAGTLTFVCSDVPSADVDVNIVFAG